MLSDVAQQSLRSEYIELRRTKKRRTGVISSEFPSVGTLCKKRFQTVHPELGVIHACNESILPLMQFCTKYRDYNSECITQKLFLSDALESALGRIRLEEALVRDRSAQDKAAALTGLYQEPEFVQISNFIADFRRWTEGGYDGDRQINRRVYLEPFQKNLLIHVIFFVAVTKMPVLANRVLEYLLHVFDIEFISRNSVNLFKQKATVFLVPRRHGKTWFMIPIICFLLKNIIGISIGYVAHQKHVSQFVLKEVEFRCRRMFSSTHTIENKDNVISIDHHVAKSTALFASCYNTNVSNPGASFLSLPLPHAPVGRTAGRITTQQRSQNRLSDFSIFIRPCSVISTHFYTRTIIIIECTVSTTL